MHSAFRNWYLAFGIWPAAIGSVFRCESNENLAIYQDEQDNFASEEAKREMLSAKCWP